MESGCFGKFGKVDRLKEKLSYFSYVHEHPPTRHELTAVVRITNKVTKFRDLDVLEGVIVDQIIAPIVELVKNANDQFEMVLENKPINVLTRFNTIGNGIIILENSRNQISAFKVLSQAMANVNDFVRYVNFDLERIYKDFHGKWMTTITDRRGNWHSGTNYGDDLEDDDVIGTSLATSSKKRVGFYTRFFQNDKMKVSVTRDGSVTVWGAVTRDQFFEYAMNELARYMIEVPS